MRPGPKPKHPALKLLAGNPGKRGARPTGAGRVRKGLPDRPPELTGEAAAEWDRLAPELLAAGLLAVTDRGILAAYCLACAEMLAARACILADGRFIRKPVQTSKGAVVGHTIIPHPALKLLNTASDRVAKLAAAIGLTATSRAKLEGDAPAPDQAAPANKVAAIRERIRAARGG